MHRQQLRSLRRALILLMVNLVCLGTAMAQVIPANRRTDWTYAGVPGGVPYRTNICATFSPGATGAQINAAITACSAGGGGVVKLNAGTYDITGIAVNASNVTLRGAGADQTILRGGYILSLGSGYPQSPNTSVTGGGAKDTFTFTVASTSGLQVNQMIEIDRDDDPNVVVATNGATRCTRQVNLITAVNGNTVTVSNPFFLDFTTGNPKITNILTTIRSSGVEDLKLDHSTTTSSGTTVWSYCYGCWMTGVESYKSVGYHFLIYGLLNSEFRDSYIHESQTYGPNNSGLLISGQWQYGGNSSLKIENNVFDRLFPAIEVQSNSSGLYFGYNYFHASQSQLSSAPVTWTLMDNHAPHNRMNLWEGNVGEMFGSDGYFGGSSHGTVFRNFMTGYNPRFATKGNPIRLLRLSYYYNLVGNVLGSVALAPPRYSETQDACGGSGDCRATYMLGYPNIGNASLTDTTGFPVAGMTYPDAKVTSTLLRWGNYDYFNRATRWESSEIPAGVSVPGDHVIPASYYYTSRPSWFPTGVAWPPIGPDVTGANGGGNGTSDTSGHVNKIPAQLCWESRGLVTGGTFNASACYPRPPAAPSNVRVR